jgi:ABC-2 type transport system ATP-binding protein
MSSIPANDRYLAQLENVYKSYGGKTVVEGLNLTVRPGELMALLGPNGAGKTTTISMLLGLQRPDAGSVRLCGRSPDDIEARRGIGVMLQEAALANELRLTELLESVAAYYPDPYTVAEAIELTGTSAIAHRPYGKLSGGQKRLAQFALAICGRPQLLFLDEPTTGLDIDKRETLWTLVRELVSRGTAVILTTHYLEEAEALADRVVVMTNGRTVASGTVEHIRGFVSCRRVSCITSVDIAQIKSWPEVLDSELDARGRLHLTTSDADTVARRLLAVDPLVRDLEVHRAGLNEAFREITKETVQ